MKKKYVKQEGDLFIIKRLPTNASPKRAENYVKAVRAELDAAFDASTKVALRINLEGNTRGGYFRNSSVAVSEVISEAVDLARKRKAPKVQKVRTAA